MFVSALRRHIFVVRSILTTHISREHDGDACLSCARSKSVIFRDCLCHVALLARASLART